MSASALSSMQQKVGAMPETKKMDGPAPVNVSSQQNKFAANVSKPLPKPGFSN